MGLARWRGGDNVGCVGLRQDWPRGCTRAYRHAMLDYIVLDCYTCILFDWYNNNDYYCWLRYERDNNICYCFACRNWITIYIWTGAIGLVVWSVAFTDDGWRANLHGLHLVYDLILFCFSGLFLVFWHLSFGFSMVSGSCQLCLSISLVYIWGYYQFIFGKSRTTRSNSCSLELKRDL